MAPCELVWTSFSDNAKYISASSQGTEADPRFHPTQKPVTLYEELLRYFAQPGDKILDTHAGSASCAVDCIKKGFDWMAFEINAAYYEKAKERIERTRQEAESERAQIRMEGV